MDEQAPGTQQDFINKERSNQNIFDAIVRVILFFLGAFLAVTGVKLISILVYHAKGFLENGSNQIPEIAVKVGKQMGIAPLTIQNQTIDISSLVGMIIYGVVFLITTILAIQLILTSAGVILKSIAGSKKI